MDVLLTIWGTPKWANGGKGPAYLPKKLSDLTTFSRALCQIDRELVERSRGG